MNSDMGLENSTMKFGGNKLYKGVRFLPLQTLGGYCIGGSFSEVFRIWIASESPIISVGFYR